MRVCDERALHLGELARTNLVVTNPKTASMISVFEQREQHLEFMSANVHNVSIAQGPCVVEQFPQALTMHTAYSAVHSCSLQ